MDAIGEGFLELGARVGRFEPPFAFLRCARAGFTSETRFLLDRYLEGVPLAIEAWNYRYQVERLRLIGGVPEEALRKRNVEEEFLRQFESEYFRFRREQYPWEVGLYKSGRSQTLRGVLERTVTPTLVRLGFRTPERFAERGVRYRGRIGGLEVRVVFERDEPTGSLSCDLEVPGVISETLGGPFFFSGSTFSFNSPADLEEPLGDLMGAWSAIYPEIATMLSSATTAADAD